jgi:RNA polymerase sigma factor (sigma-70 family)
MADDAELLRRYAQDHSEEAFAELVRNNLGLVYHAALRQCGDAQLAQDVAQTVFNDLARKARSLASRPVLAGWLYTSSRYAALHVVRTEGRRQAREREAHAMKELLDGAEPAANWEQLRPVIDVALNELAERDREAVLLRFFEGRPFAEIGGFFAVTEDAARMRVERALEKMRVSLGRSGVTSTAAALAGALTTQAGAAVPAGAAAKIAAAALGAGPASAVATFMTITKLQLGVAAAIAALGVAGLVHQNRTNARLMAEAAALRQAGAENARLQEENVKLVKAAESAGNQANAAPPPTAAAQGLPNAAGAVSRQTVPLGNGLAPVDKLGNSGRATPRNAFATQLWAARTGDIALEASAITFGPEARARLEALAATLPDDMRAEYDTPEKLMAFMLAGSPHPVGGMQVLGEVDVDANDVTLQTEWQHVDDSVVHQTDVNLVQDADGWKMVVPLSLVNRASNYLSRTLELPEAGASPGK